MKKISIIPFVCLMLLFLSCGRQTDSSPHVVSVSMGNLGKCDDVVSKIEIVPLDTAKSAYMSSIRRCVIDGERSFFVDSRGVIFLFGRDGRLLASSQRVYGQGNGEYNVCLCASYNKFSNSFEVVTPLGMNIYDSKFKYVKTVHFPDKNEGIAKNRSYFNYIYDIGADRHLLMTSCIAPDPAHIFIYNSKSGEMENDLRPTEKPFGITMQENCISDTDFFAMPWLDYTFYTIDFNSMRLDGCVKLGFGSDALTETDLAGIGDDEGKKAKFFMTCTKPLPVRTFRSGETLVSMLKCGPRRSDFRLLLADLSTGRSSVVEMDGDKFSMPFVENVVGGVAYCYATDSEIDKYVCTDLLDSDSRKVMETLQGNGNTVILKYHLRK